MKSKLLLLLMLAMVGLAGCKSPTYTADTKSELSKLCVYEFPYSPKPISTTIDTIVFNKIEHVRGYIDCTDLEGVQEVELEVPTISTEITETNVVQDASREWYIKDLEFNLEKSTQHNKELLSDIKKINKRHNKTVLLFYIALIILGGYSFYKTFK